MARMPRLVLVIAALGGIAHPLCGFGQMPKPSTTASVPTGAAEADVLPSLPRPPDAPASLFQERSATPPYSCDPLPGPYFELDPLLDPPCLPQPGWFTNFDLGIIGPHVKNRLTDTVLIDGRPPDIIHVPDADLEWTAAPRIEAGYRLPSGFGEFAFSYRFFATDGSGVVQGPDALATLKSRLSVNVFDLDYASREFFAHQWPYVEMKWRFGLRWADVFFDSRADEPFAAAAAGSDIFETRTGNNFWGVGPHMRVDLLHRLARPGLALVGSVDGATLLGRIRQNFFEESTTPGANGQLLSGNTRESVSQDVPAINAFIGLSWQPSSCPSACISAGY